MAAVPSIEDGAKIHPYQRYGPPGAYESRQASWRTRGAEGPVEVPGFYIRVDMSGIPDDGVKVVRNSEKRTVTFTGKANKLWANLDTSDRVYAGYVVLDRDPDEVDVQVRVKNGCLRIFFPFVEAGSLHFLSPLSVEITPDDVVYDDDTVEIVPGLGEKYITFVEHTPSPVITLRGGRPEHINPFLLSGAGGVYEHRIVKGSDGDQLVYVRLDVPDVAYRKYMLCEVLEGILFSTDSLGRCSPFDEEGRGYMGVLRPNCECCVYEVLRQDMRHGVVRFLARKARSLEPHRPCSVYTMVPPSKPGDDPKPKELGIDVNLRAYFGSVMHIGRSA